MQPSYSHPIAPLHPAVQLSQVQHSGLNVSASGSGAASSMGIEIAAARTHHENMRTSIQTFSVNGTKARLVDMKTQIGSKTFCCPCWVNNANEHHDESSCQNMAH